MRTTLRSLFLAGLALAALPAQAAAQRRPADLGTATIEELMNMRVTTASRRSERAEDVPAAVYVITREAIRRSGLATVPEILRLAPGVQVAQANASRWAISIRGFNDVYSNKLLVLVDGRSVYSRTFSGVFWDLRDLMTGDIERIEVIRGAAGVAWGANAVNGVINIITRNAADTQGTAVDISLGTFEQARVGVRHGGRLGPVAYRVFSQASRHDDAEPGTVVDFSDRWHRLSTGTRMDWTAGKDAVLAHAQFTTAQVRPGWSTLPAFVPGVQTFDGIGDAREASVQGGWTRTQASGSVLQVQAYHTYTARDEPLVRTHERTSDLHAQYDVRIGGRQSVVFGGGYRHFAFDGSDTVTAHVGAHRLNTVNVFVQDQVTLRPGLDLTLGAKVEHDTFGGTAFTPNARIMWQFGSSHHLWGAFSRAHRAPAITDRDFRLYMGFDPAVPLPVLVTYRASPDYGSEESAQAEAGYRVRIGPRASLDATVFHGRHEGLPTYEPFAPSVEFTPAPPHILAGIGLQALLNARSTGAELAARWEVLPGWELAGWYAFYDLSVSLDPVSLDAVTGQTDGKAPRHQWRIDSAYTLRSGILLGSSVAHSGRLRTLGIPDHTRVDARAEFRLHPGLTAAFVGQNLLTAAHAEFSGGALFAASKMPRAARVELRWDF